MTAWEPPAAKEKCAFPEQLVSACRRLLVVNGRFSTCSYFYAITLQFSEIKTERNKERKGSRNKTQTPNPYEDIHEVSLPALCEFCCGVLLFLSAPTCTPE